MSPSRHAGIRRLVTATTVAGLSAGVLAFAAPAQADGSTVITDLQVNLDHSRAKGHTTFLPGGGVSLVTDASDGSDPKPGGGTWSANKAAGYFAVDVALADSGEPSMAWNTTTSTTQPGLQLVADLDGNGTIDATLVGEPVYGDDWWMPAKTIDEVPVAEAFREAAPTGGGSGSEWTGTLDEWREAFPQARVVKTGWSLGSGIQGSGTIESLTLGATTYTFAPAPRSTVTVPSTSVDLRDTRAKGHNEFSSRGVNVWTEDTSSLSKAAGYFAVDTALADAGEPSWNLKVLDGTAVPGMQLVTDFDGNGTADGILVGEPGVYGNDWWVSNGAQQFVKDASPSHTGGYGSENHGTLWQWRAAFPHAQVLSAGWSLGSGVKGDVRIADMTVGATTHRFIANHAPVAPAVGVRSVAGRAATVTLAASDSDGDALTYGTTTPGASIVGSTLKIAVAPTFVGTKVVTYTATDVHGVRASGTVRVWVAKASAKVSQSIPAKVKKGKRVSLKVAVTSTGAVRAGLADVYLNGRKVRTVKVGASGTAKVSLGKAKKGTYRVVTKFRGTSSVNDKRSDVSIVKVK